MGKLGRRFAGVAAAVLLVVGGLSGCGPAAPKTAQELLERNAKLEDRNNFHADVTYDMKVSLLGAEMPISMSMALDTAGDSTHGTMTASMFGQDITSELYVAKEGEEYVEYESSELLGKTSWSRSTTEFDSLSASLTSEKLLADAEFAAIDDGYTLTVPGAKLMEAMDASGDVGSLGDLLGDDSIASALGESDAVLTFDKDCRLLSVDYALDTSADAATAEGDAATGDAATDDAATDDAATDDAATDGAATGDATDGIDNEGFSLDMSLSMTLKIVFSGYGTVSEEAVAVPDEVRDAAKDSGGVADDLASLLGGDEAATLEEVVDEAEQDAEAAA